MERWERMEVEREDRGNGYEGYAISRSFFSIGDESNENTIELAVHTSIVL